MKTKTSRIIKTSLALAALAAPSAMVFAETSGSTDVNLSIDPTLSIALSTNHIEFDGNTPNLLTENMTVTGATNSANGYTISFNANNEYTSLKHESQTVSENIPTLSGTTAVSSFPNVAWGYTNSLSSISDEVSSSTNFSPIPQTSTNVFETSANGSASHIFTTGVKVNGTIPAGAYSNDLLFTIVANYVEEPEGPLEPYYGVDLSNDWSLSSTIYGSTYDHERFPWALYGKSSSRNNRSLSADNKTFSGEVTFNVDLYNAFAQWTVDLTNNGEDSAMLASLPVVSGLTDAQKEFVDVKTSYEYGTPIQPGDLIRPGEMKRVLIEATYKEGYTGEFHTGEQFSFNLEFPYAKANHHAREVHDGAGWLNSSGSDHVYTYKEILSQDYRRYNKVSEVFTNPRADGVIVSFQRAYERDLSNAVEMDSGLNYEDLSLMHDGSVIGWIELNEDGIDYDGPNSSDKQFYDYYVYTPYEKVIVGTCDQLFDNAFGYINKFDLNGFDLNRCSSAHMAFAYMGNSDGSSVPVPFTLDLGDWNGVNLRYANDMFIAVGGNRPNGAEIIFSDNWNPMNLESASYMFHFFGEHSSEVTLDTSGWQLPNLLDMSFFYADIGDLSPGGKITIIADDMYIPRVTNMGSTFFNIGSSRAKEVTISTKGWTFDNVTDMSSFLRETCAASVMDKCDIDIDIRTPNVENMQGMFRGVNAGLLNNIDFTKFNTSKVTNMYEMFSSLRGGNGTDTLTLDLSSFSTPALEKANTFMSSYGLGDIKNLIIDMSGFDFSGVTDLSSSYSRLLNPPSSIENVTIYVKDQTAKDFVVNKSTSQYGSRGVQSSEVVIK